MGLAFYAVSSQERSHYNGNNDRSSVATAYPRMKMHGGKHPRAVIRNIIDFKSQDRQTEADLMAGVRPPPPSPPPRPPPVARRKERNTANVVNRAAVTNDL